VFFPLRNHYKKTQRPLKSGSAFSHVFAL
jgi:hypothetical protein